MVNFCGSFEFRAISKMMIWVRQQPEGERTAEKKKKKKKKKKKNRLLLRFELCVLPRVGIEDGVVWSTPILIPVQKSPGAGFPGSQFSSVPCLIKRIFTIILPSPNDNLILYLQPLSIERLFPFDLSKTMISPFVLFPAFVVVNFLNFVDRAIIPATSNEFLLFISSTTTTSRPNIYFGMLQSAFIVGFAVSSIFFASLIRSKGAFYVIAMGLVVWVIAAIGAGIAFRFHCFGGIFIARMLSGVGEASFVGSAAPWLATNAPIRSKGMWLAVFYTAIPVGTAFGYSYASYVADHIGVDWAFIFQAVAMLPIIAIFSYAASEHSPTIVHGHESEVMDSSKLEVSFYTATEGSIDHYGHGQSFIDGGRDTSCSHCEELGLPTTSPSRHHLCSDGLITPGLHQRKNESDGGGYVQLSMQPGEDSFDISIDVTGRTGDEQSSPQSSSHLLHRPRSPIKTSISSSPSLLDDIVFIMHQPIYLCITLGCAAQVAGLLTLILILTLFSHTDPHP